MITKKEALTSTYAIFGITVDQYEWLKSLVWSDEETKLIMSRLHRLDILINDIYAGQEPK